MILALPEPFGTTGQKVINQHENIILNTMRFLSPFKAFFQKFTEKYKQLF